jgi:hypothetical protein
MPGPAKAAAAKGLSSRPRVWLSCARFPLAAVGCPCEHHWRVSLAQVVQPAAVHVLTRLLSQLQWWCTKAHRAAVLSKRWWPSAKNDGVLIG